MCEHGALPGALSRCRVHGGPGAQVWVWRPRPAAVRCPCVDAERFVVAHERAAVRWLAAADVVVARPVDGSRVAAVVAAFARLPGRPLVFVPRAGGGAVLGGRNGLITVPAGVCAACAYPWSAGLAQL
jgi:hypothetical protein